MSTLNRAFRVIRNQIVAIWEMVMPRRCPICNAALQRGHYYICTRCLLDAPLTNTWLDDENYMTQRIKALRPNIEMASSLIFYVRRGLWSHSIHRLKYGGEWRFSLRYGEWLGALLRQSPHYRDVDGVVAVPLHPQRILTRGYNQSEYIAQGVARSMGIEHLRGAMRRTRNNPPQVKVDPLERWRNVENLFEVCSKDRLAGRNILLVDDVFTTGATMISCAEAMLDSTEGLRLWIATVALAKSEAKRE